MSIRASTIPNRLWRVRRWFKRRRLTDPRIVLGVTLVGLVVLAGLLAPIIAPYSPTKQDYNHMLVGPGWPHLLGTDEFGRDILSRLLWGTRISLAVAGGAVLIAALLGVPAGICAGYFGKVVDLVLMRLTDLILIFPPILLAIAIVAFFGPSLFNLTVVIGLTYSPRFTRLAYATTLTTRTSLFVEASRALGARDLRVLARDILPNILPTLMVQASIALGFGVLLESGLSFLGLGVQPPTPSWGLMISDARMTMGQSPLSIVWPSLTITTTIFAIQLASDALRDSLDPTWRVR